MFYSDWSSLANVVLKLDQRNRRNSQQFFLNAVIPSRYASVKSLMCGVTKIAAQQYCIVAAAVCDMACACAVISAVIARGQ